MIFFFLEGKERNEVIEFWGMVLYIFNEYKKNFFKVKKKNYTRFLSLFHELQFSIGVKDPSGNSWPKQKSKKRIKLLHVFFLGELKMFVEKFI